MDLFFQSIYCYANGDLLAEAQPIARKIWFAADHFHTGRFASSTSGMFNMDVQDVQDNSESPEFIFPS